MSKDLKNIKDLLSDFEFEYNHEDWLKLEKDLSKSAKFTKYAKYFVISSLAIILAVVIYFGFFNDNSKNSGNIIEMLPFADSNSNDFPSEVDNTLQDETSNQDDLNKKVKREKAESEESIKDSNTSQTIPMNVNKENDIEHDNRKQSNVIITRESLIEESENNKNVITEAEKKVIQNIRIETKIVNNCTPAKVVFSASNIPNDYKIKWDTDNGEILFGNNVEYTYEEGGNYMPTASLIHNNSVLQYYDIKKISVSKSNYAKIKIENDKNSFNFMAETDPNSKVNFTWYIMNESFYGQNIQYLFNKTGKYRVYLTVSNNVGCVTTVAEDINVGMEPEFLVPDLFIPNKGGVLNYFGPIGNESTINDYSFIVKDKAENIVFKSNDIHDKWNGKIINSGQNAENGVYSWEMKAVDRFGNQYSKIGNVTLNWE